jgi:hypothetical protein
MQHLDLADGRGCGDHHLHLALVDRAHCRHQPRHGPSPTHTHTLTHTQTHTHTACV